MGDDRKIPLAPFIVEDQSRTIAFLEAQLVARDESTRMARSFFWTPDRAYKLKRAVKFPLHGFRPSRSGPCAAEVEINHRLAPEIYLGVVPVRRGPDGALTLGAVGEAAGDGRLAGRAALTGRVARPWRRGALRIDGRAGADCCKCATAFVGSSVTPVDIRQLAS